MSDALRQRMTELVAAIDAEPIPVHEPTLSVFIGRLDLAEEIRAALKETAA